MAACAPSLNAIENARAPARTATTSTPLSRGISLRIFLDLSVVDSVRNIHVFLYAKRLISFPWRGDGGRCIWGMIPPASVSYPRTVHRSKRSGEKGLTPAQLLNIYSST